MKGRNIKRPVLVGISVLFLMSFAAAFVFFGGWFPGITSPQSVAKKLEEKPKICETTKLKKAIIFACEDKVFTSIPTTSKFVGMDYEALEKEFPPKDGWKIDDSVPNEVIIIKSEGAICPYHREFRHLGVDEGYLGIFEGPLGFNEKVLQREGIPIYLLPPEIQEDLNMGMNYLQQTPDEQARLKGLLEFEDEAKLSSVLENFDEYKEEY